MKNDERDAIDLADMLRLGRLPEAWVAPPATRELRELVRYRAKLVGLRSGLKAQVQGLDGAVARHLAQLVQGDAVCGGVGHRHIADVAEHGRVFAVVTDVGEEEHAVVDATRAGSTSNALDLTPPP